MAHPPPPGRSTLAINDQLDLPLPGAHLPCLPATWAQHPGHQRPAGPAGGVHGGGGAGGRRHQLGAPLLLLLPRCIRALRGEVAAAAGRRRLRRRQGAHGTLRAAACSHPHCCFARIFSWACTIAPPAVSVDDTQWQAMDGTMSLEHALEKRLEVKWVGAVTLHKLAAGHQQLAAIQGLAMECAAWLAVHQCWPGHASQPASRRPRWPALSRRYHFLLYSNSRCSSARPQTSRPSWPPTRPPRASRRCAAAACPDGPCGVAVAAGGSSTSWRAHRCWTPGTRHALAANAYPPATAAAAAGSQGAGPGAAAARGGRLPHQVGCWRVLLRHARGSCVSVVGMRRHAWVDLRA